jgi:hypothetical protein
VKMPRLSLPSRGSAVVLAPAGQLVPARTSFDFLDGAFRSNERARVKGLVALGTSGLLLVFTLIGGLGFATQNSSALTQVETANRQVSDLSMELGQLSNTGGLGEQQLSGRLQVLRVQLDQAASDQVQVLTIVNELRAVLPAGAQVTSVEVKRTDAGAQQLTVQVAVETLNRLPALSEGFASVWYLSDLSISWTSGSDRVAVTVTANVDPGLSSGPVARLRSQIDAALASTAPGSGTGAGSGADAGSDSDAGSGVVVGADTVGE